MADQNRVAFAETVEEGLAQLLGEAEPRRPRSPPPDRASRRSRAIAGSDVAAGLVAEAQRLYDEAQDALADGDLGTYQERIDELAPVLERLAELTGNPSAVTHRLP